MAGYRRHCLETTKSRFNKHMRIVKAAFRRCRKQLLLTLSRSWLEDLLEPLEMRSLVTQEAAIFTPRELRTVYEAASTQFTTIIQLATNCALGNKDIARLSWGDLNLQEGLPQY